MVPNILKVRIIFDPLSNVREVCSHIRTLIFPYGRHIGIACMVVCNTFHVE